MGHASPLVLSTPAASAAQLVKKQGTTAETVYMLPTRRGVVQDDTQVACAYTNEYGGMCRSLLHKLDLCKRTVYYFFVQVLYVLQLLVS